MLATCLGFHGAKSEIDLEIFLDPLRPLDGGGGLVCALMAPEDTAKLSLDSALSDRCCGGAGAGLLTGPSGEGMSATAAACKNTDRFDRAVFRLTADWDPCSDSELFMEEVKEPPGNLVLR